MKTTILRGLLAASLLGSAAILAAAPSSPILAAQRADAVAPEITKLGLRSEINSAIRDANSLIGKKDFPGALAKIQMADAAANKNTYEEYMVSRVLAQIAINMDNHALASDALSRMLATGATPQSDMPVMLSNAMAVSYNANAYAKAAEFGLKLSAIQPLTDEQKSIVAQSYFEAQDYTHAAEFTQKLIDEAKAAGKQPSLPMVQILFNSKVQAKDQEGARKALDLLAEVSEDPAVWRMMTNQVLGGGHNLGDHEVINLLRLRLLTNSMEEDDYSTIATLSLQVGLPAEAKAVLEKGVASTKISAASVDKLMKQAQNAVPADEKALPTLAAAAQAAKTGDAAVKYGESLYSYGRLDEALAQMDAGIMKGGLKDEADAQLTYGIVLFAAGKKAEAAKAFQAAEASGSPKSGPVAHVWVKYMAKQGTSASAGSGNVIK